LKGKSLTDALLRQAGEAAAGEVHIEADLHGSAAYKKQLLRVYLGRTINEARKPVD
jgi:carbon-monoxide dehydrogenase medium subunit